MSAMPFAPGELVADKYRVERILGEGGYGVVLAAEHVVLGGRVAIKVLRPEMAKEREIVERFLREGRAAVRIKGEHVSRVLDVGSTADGVPFMVMEYLDGHDLGHVVERGGPLPIVTAVDYILQACEALAEAHGLGIIHRDIKPSNLFLTETADGRPSIKVLDFGISKLIDREADGTIAKLTQTQAILGTPQYMAPEQMRSSRPVDQRTDIWALGGTLFELVTGRTPFDANTMAELFAQILQDAPPQLVSLRPDAHPGLGMILERCLQKQPQDRFNDVQELAMALAPFSSNGPESSRRIQRLGARASQNMPVAAAAPAPAARTAKLQPWPSAPPRKSRTPVLLVLGPMALIVGGVAIFFLINWLHIRHRHALMEAGAFNAIDAGSPSASVTPIDEPIPAVSVSVPEPAVSTSTAAPTPTPAPTRSPSPKATAAPSKPTGVASSRFE